MEEEIKFDIVIIGEQLLKYSPFAFGTAFTNIQHLLSDKISKSQKNLEDYFKAYGLITDKEGNTFEFKNITSFSTKQGTIYHLNFKPIINKHE